MQPLPESPVAAAAPALTRAPVRPEWWLALLVVVVYGYFYSGTLANQNARYDAIFAFVEPGHPEFLTFRIDRFLPNPAGWDNTMDWSLAGGHYYANKAPGTMLLGALVYLPLYWGERWAGARPETAPVAYANAYLINLAVSVLPLALAAGLYWRVMQRLNGGRAAPAMEATLVLLFGSWLLPMGTKLWGHSTAAACWVLALYGLTGRGPRAVALAGLGAGLAVLTEYLSAILLPVCAGGLLARGEWRTALAAWRRTGPAAAARTLWASPGADCCWFALGGALPLAAYLAYHRWCFGSAVTTANAFQNPEFNEPHRLLGMFGRLDPAALWGLTFSPYRGLFYGAPVLLLAALGFWWGWRERRARWLWGLTAAAVGVMLLANTSFNGWHGGYTTGPRYLVPVLPFLVLGLAWLPETPVWRWARRVLLVGSFLVMVALVAVTPFAPPTEPNPVATRVQYWLAGNYLPARTSPMQFRDFPPVASPYSMFNWGLLAGLRGHFSLLPLAALALPLLVALWRAVAAGVAPPPGGSMVRAPQAQDHT